MEISYLFLATFVTMKKEHECNQIRPPYECHHRSCCRLAPRHKNSNFTILSQTDENEFS
jgi:hypothetical protein